MPAQREEIVVDADTRQPEHLREQARQRALVRRLRFAGGGLRREVRRGQRLAIDLAVGGERQRLEHDDGGGHHVVGQVLGQITAQCRRLRLRVLCGNGIADQLPIARLILACDHGGLGHLGMLFQHGLHFTRLDAEAADLDLLVDAAEEFEGAVVAPAAQIAGAIEPRAGRAERIGDEALGGQAGAVEVAARDAGATDAEFARRADRHGPQHRIEQVNLRVVDGRADGQIVGAGHGCAHRSEHGGFGGAVGVDHAPAMVPALDQCRRDGLAGHDQIAHRGQAVLGHDGEHGRRQGDVGDALAQQQGSQRRTGHEVVGRGHHGGGAGEQRPQQLGERGIEAGGSELQDAAAGAQLAAAHVGADKVRYAAMADEHALGLAGGAGSVDEVGGVLGCDGQAGVVSR
ncbi:hypothetical protein MAFF241648_36820 (plasmid) [Ralstonia solanacearum]|nr:hypothetical protein MAFF241648_36820 [Ralstonia solanacearum]